MPKELSRGHRSRKDAQDNALFNQVYREQLWTCVSVIDKNAFHSIFS